MNREPITFDSLPLVIQKMIENDDKAANVIDELTIKYGEENTLFLLILLDDMNIRGVQIRSLYDMCGNIDNFYEKIMDITEKDIDNLNEKTYAVCKQKAIFDGNKEDRQNNPEKYMFTEEEREEILKDEAPTEKKDLFPRVNTNEALKIIDKYGFKCGYEIPYNENTMTYRVFYNDSNDIMYTHSLKDPDIFLWGESKLNVVRKIEEEIEPIPGVNAYRNVKGVVGYNIELREHPFNTYQNIIASKKDPIDKFETNYYDNNLIPVIHSEKSLEYKDLHKTYVACVVADIYDLLKFSETYENLDERLKEIYKELLPNSTKEAYDKIIDQMISDEEFDIALELQKSFDVELNKEELLSAKERHFKKQGYNTPKSSFLNLFFTKDPIEKELDKKIARAFTLKVN